MPATKIGDKIIRVDAVEKARGDAILILRYDARLIPSLN